MKRGTKNPHNPIWNKKISEGLKGRIGAFSGRKHTKEAKEKIRRANLRKHLTNETREKFRQRQLGKKLSKITIKRMIAARSWYVPTQKTKEKQSLVKLGSNNPMFGKKLTIEHRKKLSESAKKYWKPKVNIEKKHSFFRIRHSFEYKLWREAVFKRDNYTCIWCGDNKGGNLNADHIKPFALFPELRFSIDNGRTLCIDCHKKTETWGNGTRKLQFK